MPGRDQLRLDDQLCFALYAATNTIVRRYRPLLSRLGITYPQYLALMTLWEDGPSSVGHIASRLQLPGHALTPIVARLEAAGLLTRHTRPGDRRVVLVALTAAGADLETAAAEAQRTIACATGLAPDEFEDLRSSLHDLVDHMVDTSVDESTDTADRSGPASRPIKEGAAS